MRRFFPRLGELYDECVNYPTFEEDLFYVPVRAIKRRDSAVEMTIYLDPAMKFEDEHTNWVPSIQECSSWGEVLMIVANPWNSLLAFVLICIRIVEGLEWQCFRWVHGTEMWLGTNYFHRWENRWFEKARLLRYQIR